VDIPGPAEQRSLFTAKVRQLSSKAGEAEAAGLMGA
jgi:hypothetical protein